jgi:DNA-binding NtrC family response regulator
MTMYQIVIIDDDPEMESRPLYEELVEKYGKENIIWKENADDGLSFIKQNLDKKIIIILDYDFGSKRDNGLKLFQKIQDESILLYIILNTAKSIIDIPNNELKAFINNHLMALVDKTDGYEKTLSEIEKAINYLNNRVDCILEEWILRHEFFTREKPYIKDENGNNVSLNDVLREIRKNTDFGRKMSSNIISTAISLLQKDINKISNQ